MPNLFMALAKGTLYRYVSLHSLFRWKYCPSPAYITILLHGEMQKVVQQWNAWACYMPNNNLVVLAHIQLKSFYPLSTCDVTLLGMVPGPLLLNCTANDGKLGEGLGTKLFYMGYGYLISRNDTKHFSEWGSHIAKKVTFQAEYWVICNQNLTG